MRPLPRVETGKMFDLLFKGRRVGFEDREMTRNHVIIQSGGVPVNVMASVDYILKETNGVSLGGSHGRASMQGKNEKVFSIAKTRVLGIGVRAEYRPWAMMLYFIATFLLVLIYRRLTGELSVIMVFSGVVSAEEQEVEEGLGLGLEDIRLEIIELDKSIEEYIDMALGSSES